MKRRIGIFVIIASLFVLSSLGSAKVTFTDVNNHWAKETIEWGSEEKIVEGYPNGTFKPNNHVTEAEFLSMLIRAFTPDDYVSEIVNQEHWADPVYFFSDRMNYPMRGFSELAKRNWIIDREHVARIIAGTQGKNYSGRNAIHYLLSEGLAAGRNPNQITVKNFGGEDPLTRAESLTFIRNLLDAGVTELQPRPTQPSDSRELKPLPEPTQPSLPVEPPSISSPTQPSQPSQPPGGQVIPGTAGDRGFEAYESALKEAFVGTGVQVQNNGQAVSAYHGTPAIQTIIAGYRPTNRPNDENRYNVITIYKTDDDSLQAVKTMFETAGATDTDNLIETIKKALENNQEYRSQYGIFKTFIHSAEGRNTVTIHFRVGKW